MASEKAREREVHKYYQSWLESSVGYNTSASSESTRYHTDNSRLRPSKDKALIAFAQLGCLRLNVKRGIISLISSERQYVLAEATKTLSLVSDSGDKHQLDELWFGNASFPREEGVSEAALSAANHTAFSTDGSSHTCSALVINDLAEDEKYHSRAFAGQGVSFYCGVPILAPSGFAIGVYAMTDNKPRDGLNRNELLFLNDMAGIIMDHFETVKNDAARFRGEKMVLGIGRFIQGASTLQRSTRPNKVAASVPDTEGRANSNDTEVDRPRLFKGLTITDADPSLLRQLTTSNSASPESIRSSQNTKKSTSSDQSPAVPRAHTVSTEIKTQPPSDEDEPGSKSQAATTAKPVRKPSQSSVEIVFSRAANILRECASADGVLFLDAVSVNLAKRSTTTAFRRQSTDSDVDFVEDPKKVPKDRDGDATSTISLETTSAISTASDESESGSRNRDAQSKCQLLGYSVDVSAQSSANPDTMENLSINERTLRRLIRQYPYGKVFFFSAEGTLSSSDGDHANSSGSASPSLEVAVSQSGKGQTSNAIAVELMRIVPGARNVVWLPLWDFSKQRWSAGTFLWSRRPDRLVSAQDDLVYLKSFANSIMVEVARIDAAMIDTAKSTFISNISHELRSPLHGILGSIELLQETKLDGFQSQLISAVDVCGKTLVDTVDHVLDYAKINHLSRKDTKHRTSTATPSLVKHGAEDSTASSLEDDFDLATTVEEVIDVVYAGSTSKSDTYQDGRNSPTGVPKATTSAPIQVMMDLEHRENWWVRSQPGAIRRVLMNIFGNALKYTPKGSITVSLSSVLVKKRSDRSPSISVEISVADTGRGMSADFIRNHAFTPFAQESHFSVGTGLGLSIVQQIVDSLGGKIELESEKGMGTTMKICFKLPAVQVPTSLGTTETNVQELMQMTYGKTLCIITDPAESGELQLRGQSEQYVSTLESMVKNWFSMRVIRSKSIQGVSADYLVYPSPPDIEELREECMLQGDSVLPPIISIATSSREGAKVVRECERHLSKLPIIVEVISQPVGPQKMSRVLLTCLQRLDAMKAELKTGSRIGARDPQKSDTSGPTIPSTNSTITEHDITSNLTSKSQQGIQNREPVESIVFRNHLRQSLTDASIDGQMTDHDESITPTATSGSEMRSRAEADSDQYSEKSISPGHGRRNRVLLVDDNEINLKLLRVFMTKGKYPYKTATDGLQALNSYKEASGDSKTLFTHIFMDVSMPVMDGTRATYAIREFERKSGIRAAKIFALTGNASAEAQHEIRSAGADLFVAKPLKMMQLLNLLED